MIIRLGMMLLLLADASQQSTERPKAVDPRDVIGLEAGTWDAVITSFPRLAGGTPTTATGVQVNEPRSGGRWMLNRMSVNGGAYEGTGIWGHDPATGQYAGAWVDNGTASIRKDEGVWNPDTNTMTWTSRVDRADGKVLRIRATSTFAGNRRTYRSFAVTDTGETPLSIVIFTRRSNPPGFQR